MEKYLIALSLLLYVNHAKYEETLEPETTQQIYTFDTKTEYKSVVNLCKSNQECKHLAQAIYYEARGESYHGKLAIAKVIHNRKLHDKFDDSIELVVKNGCQFSYRCDGSLYKSENDKERWKEAYHIAYYFLNDDMVDIDLNGATHYHTKKVKPYWSKKFVKTKVIGNHIFYKCIDYC